MAKRVRQIDGLDRENIAILWAHGYGPDEIVAELGLDRATVDAVCEQEQRDRDEQRSTVERLLDTRRSLTARRSRAERQVRRYHRSLPEPDEIEIGGHAHTYRSQLRRVVQLEGELAKLDDRILRIDAQIADIEAKDSVGDYDKLPPLHLHINTDERGDYPSTSGEVSRRGRDDGDDG